MPNFDELLKGKEAAGLMKDPGKLEKLRDAPETRRIFDLLSRSAPPSGPPRGTPPS